MEQLPSLLLCAVIGYLLGSVSAGILYSHLLGSDIRRHGSKNPGASNMLRIYGMNAGTITFIFDCAKAIGAVLAGSVFGDHCSPISDTTILSSAGAKCDHIAHVSTQIPYAILVAAVSFVGYLIAGFVRSPWLPLLISAALLLLAAFVISRREARRDRAS